METNEEIAEANRVFAVTTFCPLTKDKCRVDCICFGTRQMNSTGTMYGPYCGNHMFSGE